MRKGRRVIVSETGPAGDGGWRGKVVEAGLCVRASATLF